MVNINFREKYKQYKKQLFWGLTGGIILVLIIVIIVTKPKQYDVSESLTVGRHTVVESVSITGRVRTSDRAELAFNASGRIASLAVREGMKVKKGATLATLEMGSLYAQREDALAALAIAQADAATNRLEQDTLVADAYQEMLATGLEAYAVLQQSNVVPPTISGFYKGKDEGEYRIEIYDSSADSGYSYRYSGIESGRGTAWIDAPAPLGTQGLYIQFDDETRYSNSEWVVPVPNKRSSQFVRLQSAYNQALAARDRVLGNESENMSVRTKAMINQAEARVRSLNAQINEGVITAPFAGTVGGIIFEKGENVQSGEVAMTLVGEKKFEIVLSVPEIDIAKVALGDPVLITLDAYADVAWEGVIEKIAPVETYSDGVPIYETTVSITDADERIRSGMSARATIETQRIENVIAVPTYALQQKKKTTSVSVITADDEIEERLVTTGLRGSDGYVEIKEGLVEGDKIIGSETPQE